MRTRTARAGAALALTAGLIAGCESSPKPYADNPLLQARQPLLQSQGIPAGDGTQVAQSNPRMVVIPPPGMYQQPQTSAVASARIGDQQPTYKPAVTTYTPPATIEASATPPPMNAGPSMPPPTTAAISPARMPVPEPTSIPAPNPMPIPLPAAAVAPPTAVIPATATAPAPMPPATQAVVRMAEGKYGHAADYSWLQGELDRHYRGHLELRYRPISEEDPYGGKVRLEEDPLLAQFSPGDVIVVEGELLTDPDGANAAPWAQYRRYHIRAVHLVERK